MLVNRGFLPCPIRTDFVWAISVILVTTLCQNCDNFEVYFQDSENKMITISHVF